MRYNVSFVTNDLWWCDMEDIRRQWVCAVMGKTRFNWHVYYVCISCNLRIFVSKHFVTLAWKERNPQILLIFVLSIARIACTYAVCDSLQVRKHIPYWGFLLTHWGRVTHISVGKLTIIGSDNGLSPGRRQAIIWTNAGILLIEPLATKFSEILIEI